MKKITIMACAVGLAVSPFASAITYTYNFDNLPATVSEQHPLANPTTITSANPNYPSWTGPLQSVKFEGTGSSIGVFNGNDPGVAVLDGRPNPVDTGYFLSTGVGPNGFGKITFQFSTAVTGLEFLWGTPDLYNFVTLFNGATQVANFGFANNPPADQKTPVLYGGLSSSVFDRIEFTSSGIAFEFDNVKVSTLEATTQQTVPDGGTTAMLLGLSLVGLFFVQRRLSTRSI